MELIEALEAIDATFGMFRSFADEIENGELKEDLLQTQAFTSVDNYFDPKTGTFELEGRPFYIYKVGDREYKRYLVDIRPVCALMVNEWPSNKAKTIRKLLEQTLLMCIDEVKNILGDSINVALEEGYKYSRTYTTDSYKYNIETVMLDSIHEMFHALELVKEIDEKTHNNNVIFEPEMNDENAEQLGIRDDLMEQIHNLKDAKESIENEIEKLKLTKDRVGSNLIIAEERKIDVIKTLHAMCKLNLFKTKDGSKFTDKYAMQLFGEILNDDFSKYSSNLSTSKAAANKDTFLEIFDDLKGASRKYINKENS